MARVVSKAKARKILRHGSVRGHPLTPAQKRMFGARAGGAPVKGLKKRKRRKKRARARRKHR